VLVQKPAISKPTRKIYDSVHGFIRFGDLECDFIDSLPFQRLHDLHQLGIAYLVYPGARHTRFEHSLGVMELASQIFDRITSKDQVFSQAEDVDYWRHIIRLAALSHDLGHLPFSHVAEKVLLGKEGHEKWTLNIIQSGMFDEVFESLQKMYPERRIQDDVTKMAIGEKKLQSMSDKNWDFSQWEKVLCQVITGDFFGADRIDYLLRDATATGVSYGLFDYQQLIEMLCIIPVGDALELGIEENGMESCEALLLARHFMYKRVYQYSTVKAYSFHLARFMQAQSREWLQNLEGFLSFTENEILTLLRASVKDASKPGHLDACCLTERKKRFKAFELPQKITENDLENLRQSLSIPHDAISWEFVSSGPTKKRLSFSVLTEKGVFPASSLSEMVIPLASANWVYVAPEYAAQVRERL
jgi:HD superfamily phosphohydrolase